MKSSLAFLLFASMITGVWGQVGQNLDETSMIGRELAHWQQQFPHLSYFTRDQDIGKSESRIDSIYEYLFDPSTSFWEKYERIRYQYANLQDQTVTTERWNSATNQWELFQKSTQTLDEATNIIQTITQIWEASTGNWLNNSRRIQERDEANRIIRVTNLKWEDNAWVGENQYEAAWFNMDSEYEEISQIWDVSLSAWKNVRKWRWIYDADGYLIQKNRWDWEESTISWNPISSEGYVRNADHQLMSYLRELYDASTQSWVNDHQQLYSYNSQGDESEKIQQDWNNSLNLWENDRRFLTIYDGNHHQLSRVNQKWNLIQTSWENDTRSLHEVNLVGRDTIVSYQSWDAALGTWEYYERNLYEWNAGGLNSDWAYLIWENEIWIKTLRFSHTFDMFGNRATDIFYMKDPAANEWLEERKTEYFRSITPTASIADFMNLPCRLPNPMKAGQVYLCDALTLGNVYQVQLYDLSGRALLSASVRGGEGFQFPSDLAQGLYVLSISENGKLVYRDKVILEE